MQYSYVPAASSSRVKDTLHVAGAEAFANAQAVDIVIDREVLCWSVAGHKTHY